MHILLIARHYPPEVSGGARRPFLLTQALRDLGHRVTLITPFASDDFDHIHVKNRAIERGNQHTTLNIAQPSGMLVQCKNLLRQWLFWPDADIRWAKDVVKTVKNADISPDWVFTTSPAESTHIAGARLSRSHNFAWIAEMRDTWIHTPHREILERSKLRAFIERRIAKRALSQTKAVTTVSAAMMDEARIYTSPNTPELILGHFSTLVTQAYAYDRTSLNIVHTGGFTLSDRHRHLEPLLKNLTPVYAKRPELVFHIAGPLTQEEIQLTKEHPLPIHLHGSVSLEHARALQAGADGLVLYTPDESHALPGKYIEYLMARRPILYLGGGDWLHQVKDKNSLRPLVNGALDLKKGELLPINTEFSADAAAQKLIKFLNEIAQ